MKKIHIVEPWRMWSFCKIPSSLPPFIKPCPSLSYPPVWSPVSSYLVSKQSWNTCFGGIANGGEVVTPLQREHQPAAGQSHQLLGQVAKTCRRGRKEIQKGVIELARKPVAGLWSKENKKIRQYYITFSLLKRRHSGFTGPKRIIRGRFNFNKCGLAFWPQASFDLCLNICIRLYFPSPEIHIQGRSKWLYFVLILHWHEWDVL